MSEYSPIAVPDCLDNQFITDLYANIKCILDCAQDNRKEFECTPFNILMEGELNGDLVCSTILEAPPITDASDLSQGKEQKMVLFTSIVDSDYVSASQESGDEATINSIDRKYYLQCVPPTDNTVAFTGTTAAAAAPIPPTLASGAVETPSSTGNSDCIHNLCLDCSASDEIQLCVRTSASISGRLTSSRYTVAICGVVICIKDLSGDAINGFFKPPAIQEFCCYGRDALYLAMQNCEALKNRYSRTSQVSRCTQFQFDDQVAHAIHTSTGTTSYFVIGTIRVCVKNSSFNSRRFTVTPVVGCQGGTSNCPGRSYEVRGRESSGSGNDDGQGNEPTVEQCFSFRYVHCGECRPGQTLYAGMGDVDDCSGSGIAINGNLTFESIEQSYCLYTFESQAITYPATPETISPCPKPSEIGGMLTKLDQMYEICQSDQIVNLNHTELTTGEAFTTSPTTIVLKAAVPYIPTPGNPFAPEKKWNGVIEVCGFVPEIGNVNNLAGYLKVEIFCGGQPIYEDEIYWRIYQRGGSDNDQFENNNVRCVKIDHQCFLCATDMDLTLVVTGIKYANGNGSPMTGNQSPLPAYLNQAKLFCF